MPIEVRSLTFAYETEPVLEDITVTAQPGRVTAVLGPNASGKSTLLRCAIGALRPRAGCVRLDGRPTHEMPPRDLARRIAYVPQRALVSAAFTVRDVIRLGRYALAPNAARIDEAIARLDLHSTASRRFATLSVGQQQRVVLARAVAQVAPDGLLVLDEPMAAMDLRHVRQTITLLRELAAAGATVLMSLHDVSLATLAADDAWLLDGGRLAASGDAAETLTAERLESVFGVPFEVATTGGDRSILMPRILPSR